MNDLPPTSAPPQLPRPRFRWFLFLTQLFIPTIATVIAVQIKSVDAAPFIAFFGGIGSGLVGGIMLGLWVGRTPGMRAALSVAFSIGLGVAFIGLNCFGCLVSGYALDFR